MEMDFIPCSRARVPHFCVCERRARCRMNFEIYTINSKFTYLVKHAHAPCSFNSDVLPQNGDDACMVNEESESIHSCIFLNGSHIQVHIQAQPNRARDAYTRHGLVNRVLQDNDNIGVPGDEHNRVAFCFFSLQTSCCSNTQPIGRERGISRQASAA